MTENKMFIKILKGQLERGSNKSDKDVRDSHDVLFMKLELSSIVTRR